MDFTAKKLAVLGLGFLGSICLVCMVGMIWVPYSPEAPPFGKIFFTCLFLSAPFWLLFAVGLGSDRVLFTWRKHRDHHPT